MIALAAGADARSNPLARRALAQAGRELLLAQSSDWPFILRQHTSTGYARRRVREHLERFERLASGLEAGAPDAALVAELEQRDNLFPDLDAGAWRSA
jgi:1,4-alpha-glucan branching enzyme